MFERYTERARRVVFFARYEASKTGSTPVESGHLLMGLLREDKNLINYFLRDSLQIDSMRAEFEQRAATCNSKGSPCTDLQLSDDCKQILGYAAEEADRLKHRHTGTEHLLLGMLRLKQSAAAENLIRNGLELDAVRDELSRSGGFLNRRMNALRASNLSPERRMVPDSDTACRIAKAIWLPAYGTESIERQQPAVANLDRFNTWRVSAGTLFAVIVSMDGKVLSMGQSEGRDV